MIAHSLTLAVLSLISVQTLARPSTPIRTCTKTVVVDAIKNPGETCATFAATNEISLQDLYQWNRGLDSTGRCTNLDDGNAICVSVKPVRGSTSRSGNKPPPAPSTYFIPPPLSPPIPSPVRSSPMISPVVDPLPASRTDVPVEGTAVPEPTDVIIPVPSPISTSGWSETSDQLRSTVGVLLTAGSTISLLL